ncbi:hypothetical protein [Rhodopseudomonas palustris]|uniref:hypothetical protein n=1 Tax=Rhodopseudomonas palustris TaxID=1076 RepID=UPI0012EE8B31
MGDLELTHPGISLRSVAAKCHGLGFAAVISLKAGAIAAANPGPRFSEPGVERQLSPANITPLGNSRPGL